MTELQEVGLRELARIRERFDRLFEQSLSGSGLASSLATESWEPPLDPDTIEARLSKGLLTVKVATSGPRKVEICTPEDEA